MEPRKLVTDCDYTVAAPTPFSEPELEVLALAASVSRDDNNNSAALETELRDSCPVLCPPAETVAVSLPCLCPRLE